MHRGNKKVLCDQTPLKIPYGSESPSWRTLWLHGREGVCTLLRCYLWGTLWSSETQKSPSWKKKTHLDLHYASCGSIFNFLTDLFANSSEKSLLKIKHRIHLHFNKSFVHVTLISELKLGFRDSFQNLANDCQISTLLIIAKRTNCSVWALFSGQEAHALLAPSKALNYIAMHNAAP